MSRTSDLVRDSKLDTRFHTRYISHRYLESGTSPHERAVVREEYWKREKYIGGGSYGSVWLERCIKGEQGSQRHTIRAVKEIPKSQQTQKPINYNRELEAIAKFSHQKYVRCFVQSLGWYEHAEALFIAMEFFPLGDLHEYLLASPPMPESEAQQVVFQLNEGLAFLHENGFAHRDLKPGNILIKSKPPEFWWVKIGDFGISKRAEDGAGLSSTVKGTLAFMPPEVHGFVGTNDCFPRDSQAAACAADMWSLGEITFQLQTKEASFRNLGVLFAYVQHHELFPSAALQALNCSQASIDFIRRLMDPAPNKRITAVDALIHVWMEPCRAPSPKPASISTIASSEGENASPLPQSGLYAEPSGRWSTVSLHKQTSEDNAEIRDSDHDLIDFEATPPDLSPAITQERLDVATVRKTDVAASAEHETTVVPALDASAVIANSITFRDAVNQLGKVDHLDPTWRPAAPVPRGIARDAALKINQSWEAPDRGPIFMPEPRPLQHSFSSVDMNSNVTTDQGVAKPFMLHTNFSWEQAAVTTLASNSDMATGYQYEAYIPQHERSSPPFAGMDGLRVSSDSSGRVLDFRGTAVGAVLKGDRTMSAGLQVDVYGQVLDENGQMVTRALRIPQWPSSSTDPSVVTPIYCIQRFNGNFVLDIPLPQPFLLDIPHAPAPERDEFTHMRYTAATCAAHEFFLERYILRQRLFVKPRVTKMVISTVVDVSTRTSLFASFLKSLFESLAHLEGAAPEAKPYSAHFWWKSLVVLVIGRQGMLAEIKDLLAKLGLMQWFEPVEDAHVTVAVQDHNGKTLERYDDGVHYPLRINAKSVTARIYEYTTQKTLFQAAHGGWEVKRGNTPVQLVFCSLSEPDASNAESWAWEITKFLKPKLCITCHPHDGVAPDSIFNIWRKELPSLSDTEVKAVELHRPRFASLVQRLKNRR